jgi:hypothetical protein
MVCVLLAVVELALPVALALAYTVVEPGGLMTPFIWKVPEAPDATVPVSSMNAKVELVDTSIVAELESLLVTSNSMYTLPPPVSL